MRTVSDVNGLVAALVVAFGEAGPFRSVPVCDPMWLPISRPTGSISLVARFESDTVADLTSPTFAVAGPRRMLAEALRGERGPIRPRYGQRALVIESSPRLDVAEARPVVLVPWDFVSDCGPSPWLRSARWVAAGTEGFVSAWLRPRAGWVGGVPTLDVEVKGWRAAEFLRVFVALPTHDEVTKRPVESRRKVADLRRRHAALLAREPASHHARESRTGAWRIREAVTRFIRTGPRVAGGRRGPPP